MQYIEQSNDVIGSSGELTLERLPDFHYSVDFIVLSFGTMGFIVEL